MITTTTLTTLTTLKRLLFRTLVCSIVKTVLESVAVLATQPQFYLFCPEHNMYMYNDPFGGDNGSGYDGYTIMRLVVNSSTALRLNEFISPLVYGHPVFLALQDTQSGDCLRHAAYSLHLNPLNNAGPTLDFAWQFQQRTVDRFDIYNPYAGGVFLGYERPTARVLIVGAADSRRTSWMKIPICPAGYFSNPLNPTCQPCPANRYSAVNGSTACLNCPADVFSEPGSAQCTIRCLPGQKWSGTKCQNITVTRFAAVPGTRFQTFTVGVNALTPLQLSATRTITFATARPVQINTLVQVETVTSMISALCTETITKASACPASSSLVTVQSTGGNQNQLAAPAFLALIFGAVFILMLLGGYIVTSWLLERCCDPLFGLRKMQMHIQQRQLQKSLQSMIGKHVNQGLSPNLRAVSTRQIEAGSNSGSLNCLISRQRLPSPPAMAAEGLHDSGRLMAASSPPPLLLLNSPQISGNAARRPSPLVARNPAPFYSHQSNSSPSISSSHQQMVNMESGLLPTNQISQRTGSINNSETGIVPTKQTSQRAESVSGGDQATTIEISTASKNS